MSDKLAALILSVTALLLAAVVMVFSIQRKNTADTQADVSSTVDGIEKESDEISLVGLSEESIGWGLGNDKNERGQPIDAVRADESLSQYGGHFIYADSDEIFLTFDLGYEAGYTESIVDTLNEKGVKGTFFITGEYLNESPEIVEKIIASGHTLGNHTEKHPDMTSITDERATAEISSLNERVEHLFGYKMSVFRFPEGKYSTNRIAFVKNAGFDSIFWSVAYQDWLTDNQPDPAASLQKLISSAHPGAIYLLHTVSSTNDTILGDLIDGLRSMGYTLSPIPTAQGAKDSYDTAIDEWFR